MPQIAQILETYASQIFWLLITFGAIYFGIAKMMLPKITANMDSREQKIAADLVAAEKARAAAEEAEGGSDKALNEARSEAQAKAAAAKATAGKDADARLAAADAEIQTKLSAAEAALVKARDKALGELDAVAADVAADIAAKVAGLKVSASDAGKAVKQVIANG